MAYAVAALALIVFIWSTGSSRRTRERLFEEARAGWGRPRDRVRRMDVIAEYHVSRVSAGAGGLDDRTWNDLLMDAVFAVLDRTESTLGQQVLYHRLRSAPTGAHLQAFEALVERMADARARERMQAALGRLRNPAGYDLWWLAQGDVIERRAWHILFPIVGFAMCLPFLLAFIWPAALFLLLIGATVNLYIRVYSARRIGALVGSFRLIEPLLAAADSMRSISTGAADTPVSLLASLDEDLRRLARLRQIARWVGRDPIAAGDLLASVFEYLNLLFLLDANALFFGARQLEAHGEALLRVLDAVGDVDAALSVASLRAETPLWTRPVFLPTGSTTELAGFRHPLVEDAVPNSIVMGPPYGVLITGSNMSGKSTLVRAVGVNVILAQTIHTCFATSYQSPVLQVRSCIGRSDDLLGGKSYHMVEVESVLSLVTASTNESPASLSAR